ncbi:MAG TPA: sensor histidine kinase [Coleofasciculaceae cyanobacterium]|jgi:signal transduction histidine kinase
MNSWWKIQPNPFRFLLLAEWIMLGSCGSLAIIEAFQDQTIPVEHILILVLLGSMGLALPNGSLAFRVIYTTIEIGLIAIGTSLGYLHILPTLYLIVVIRSCFLFESVGRWVVAGLVLILFLLDELRYAQRALPELPEEQFEFMMHLMAQTLVFGLGIFFVLQLVNKLLVERQIKQQLAVAHQQLQDYSQQIEDLAAVQERNRIARDIHDSLGHALTSLNIQLQTAVKLWQKNPAQAHPFLAQAQKLGAIAMKEVRQSVGTLRADQADEQPLKSKIWALIDNLRSGTGLTIRSKIAHCPQLSPQIENTIYRIVQEALTNIAKYAQATEVEIKLKVIETKVYLSVQDNGKGFELNQNKTGYGLQGMQERINAVEGCLQIQTSPGAGCRILVEIPLSRVITLSP